MSEQRTMLSEMVDRLFKQLMSSGMTEFSGESQAKVDKIGLDQNWAAVEELGITDLFVPESQGGFGGCWQDAFVVFNLSGFHALPLPVGETMVAKKLLLDAGIDAPRGIITLGLCHNAKIKKHEKTGAQSFSGDIAALPWGRAASAILVACALDQGECLALLPAQQTTEIAEIAETAETAESAESDRAVNAAGEPRDQMCLLDTPLIDCWSEQNAADKITALGALLRASQMAGALEAALQLCLEHVNQRVQFGRPLSKFQAIQQQLAVLAEEGAAVNCAAQAACLALDKSREIAEAGFEIAASKLRANRSVAQATSIAHQTHGAIGFTQEHHLHYFSQRLWSWRAEFGNERYWANILGKQLIAEGAGNLWSKLTARSDRCCE